MTRWLAGWLAGWVAGWLGGWVAGRLEPPPPPPTDRNTPHVPKTVGAAVSDKFVEYVTQLQH